MNFLPNQLPYFVKPVGEKLLRGRAVSCPYRLYTMKKNGVNQIIDLRNAFSVQKFFEKMFCKIIGIKYINQKYPHRLQSLPSEGFLKGIADTVANNPQQTYVHCQYGKRRTGIVVAYCEKVNAKKSNEEISENLFNICFSDVNPDSKRGKRYFKIMTEFVEKYLS